ncbi:hypothetical protein HIM_05385 [Hirsutella minnesotensis 3608]|uniref:Uncharacterized protein n=1 Tax=Hirsutella minnesotensis 3608 TaxID=1043627 RepID=A0A0F7ZKF4_9HYPO|nr:hypothetical protein HIM_05385 [Hirsutella minnesotensis 3608]
MAHMIPDLLIRRLREMELPVDTDGVEARPGDKTPAGCQDGAYRPTPIDIVVTRVMLTRSKGLPPDVVDDIFDMAEYWAHSTNAVNYQTEHQDHLRISQDSKFLLRSFPLGLTGIHGNPDDAENLAEELVYDTTEAKPLPLQKEYDARYFAKMARYPTPRLAHPCRKIVFSIRGHDQGWGGELDSRGTYKSSWTWYEAGLERLDAAQDCDTKCTYDVRRESPTSNPPPLPVCGLRPIQPRTELGENQDYEYVHPLLHEDPYVIRRNKTSMSEWQDHVITWSYADDIKAESGEGEELDEDGRGCASGDGSFVRSLKMGDVVTIWGKARFPGWVNNVECVKVDVYWAV